MLKPMMFRVGSRVEILSYSQKRWFLDGVVERTDPEGTISVRFNGGTFMKDISVAEQPTVIRMHNAPTPAGGQLQNELNPACRSGARAHSKNVRASLPIETVVFDVGSRVEVLSVSQRRWFKDGVVENKQADGTIRVAYNAGETIKFVSVTDQSKIILPPSTRDMSYCKSDHLMNGITLASAKAFAGRLDFPDTYVRDTNLDWVSQKYGARLTGYDFCTAIRSWLTKEGKNEYSVVETLCDWDDSGIGKADIFISHVQSESLESTFAGMMGAVITNRYGRAKQEVHGPNTTFWVDYFVLRQLKSDFDAIKIAEVINAIRCTRIIVDPELCYFTRSFCMFELGASFQDYPPVTLNPMCSITQKYLEDGTYVWVPTFSSPFEGPIACTRLEVFAEQRTLLRLCAEGIPRIDAKNAQARERLDKSKIDAFIECSCGQSYDLAHSGFAAHQRYVPTPDERWDLFNTIVRSLMEDLVKEACGGRLTTRSSSKGPPTWTQ